MKATSFYSKLFNRMLYDSPLHRLAGKISLVAILLITLYFASSSWIKWLTPLQNAPILFGGMFFAVLGSLIGLAILRYLDRRKPEPWLYFIGVLIVATLFTAAPAAYFNTRSPYSTLTVGFVEEFWKVFPLLLLVIFAPTVVTGVRDGIIYGALGGFGFNIMETSVYVLRTSTPEQNVFSTISEQLGRLGWHGVGNHVLWSMLVGAGIGYAVQTSNKRLRIIVPIGAYLLAVVTHTLQDNMVGVMVMMGIAAGIASLASTGLQIPQNSPKIAELMRSATPLTLTLEALVINIVNLPLLIYALLKSGNWERQVVRDELADEVGKAITPEEYAGVLAERRFRLRRIAGYPRRLAGQIRNAQNSLAFQKHYLRRKGRAPDEDLLVQYWRAEVDRLRSKHLVKTASSADINAQSA